MKQVMILVCTLLLWSCGGTKEDKKTGKETMSISSANHDGSRRLVEDINFYFATFKPNEITTMVLDKKGFEDNFNPARTMDNPPTIIDFDTYKVAVIVLPETAYETEVTIDQVMIENRKLVIDYSINHDKEERTFTIVPMKAVQYSPQLSIDSVSFVNNDVVKTYAK